MGTKALNVIAMFFVGILLIIFGGFVLSTLWAWFVVPLGLPAISIAHALGLALLIHLTTIKYNMLTDEKIKGWILFGVIFVVQLFALGMGWIYTLFM